MVFSELPAYSIKNKTDSYFFNTFLINFKLLSSSLYKQFSFNFNTIIFMKKISLFFVFALFCCASVFGQARKELNFGLIGINYEIPVSRDITIAPGVGTDFNLDWINLGVKGNYYFDHAFGISDPAWDVYGGLNLGYSIYNGDNDHDNSSDLNLGLQVGGRWFWNDKWGLYVELAGGNISGFSPAIGLTVKL
ncbi:hypothetical protein FEM08_25180 [Flavobacterium gilvum]|nr:hypothetical protein FEM08_25180 [Flavobacterium gilvum]